MKTRPDGVVIVEAKDAKVWNTWLAKNHAIVKNAWLQIYKKGSGVESVNYEAALHETLCYGWVDSTVNKNDTKSYFVFFAKRNPKSNWSRKNKNLVKQLTSENRMQSAGLEMVKIAKETGTWDALNDVENLIVPADMQLLFDENETAFMHWENFPRSAKRGILEWIFNAKRPATRAKRIKETVIKATENIRANQYIPK